MKSIIKNSSAIAFVGALAMLAACSDSENKNISGGITEDKGIVANLDVAGVSQKGPFVKGSAVTVQGIDCKTLKFTDEVFEGKVKSDKGDFTVEDISLKSSCALFEVTGEYRNEITGKKSSGELTLHALTDLKDRKNVNINVLTELEYERLMYLVTEKDKNFADAKALAEEEVLAAFDIKGNFEEFENLNIFESGDENAALLAVSVMMQAETDDAGLVNRLDKFTDSFAETGKWKDSDTKNAISEWAVEATANGGLDSIRKNVEAWDLGDTVPAFEKFIEAYADGDSVVLSSSSFRSSSSTPVEDLSSSSAKAGSEYDATANTLKDLRDGKVYKTVKIGNQVWMAENLNFETDSSFCYSDSAKYCAKFGRLYTWTAAMNACPDGWRLPSETDFKNLIKAVGGEKGAATKLKSTSGWNDYDGRSGNGTDAFGFTALPAGVGNAGSYVGEGYTTDFWGSTECGIENSPEPGTGCAYAIYLDYDEVNVNLSSYAAKDLVLSVRCIMGDGSAADLSSSSGVTPKSSGSETSVSSSSIAVLSPCKTETEDNCEYGTLTDARDGQTYKTVKIGSQEWMAENLNYAYLQPTDSLDSSSFCYNDSLEYCEKYGRLYTWAAAVDSAGLFTSEGKGCGYYAQCTFTKHIRGVCPDGWHVPDTTEWQTLIAMVSGDRMTAGRLLKSSSGWNKYSDEIDGNGVDAFGFAVLPAGYGEVRGKTVPSSGNVGSFTRIWTATDWNDDLSEYGNDVNGGLAYYYFMHNHTDGIGNNLDYKTSAYPIRCIRD